MKKTRLAACALAAVVAMLGLTGCARGAGGLSVVASFYPMADFAAKIGGDRVHVTALVPSGAEPHDWEPSPVDIVRLNEADVFVYSGAGMEHWVEDVLKSLDNRALIAVEAAAGARLMEEGGDADPHVWLDPANAKIQMQNIRDALIAADPDGKAVYGANFDAHAAALDALDAQYRSALSNLERRELVVAHAAYGYLCRAYDLSQTAIEGLSPDSEPDPARVAQIIDFARAHAVKVIFFEELVSPKVAQSIAAQVGAETDVLSPLEGLTSEEAAAGADYFSVMQKNLAALVNALG